MSVQVSLRDVARRAGVPVATVSNVPRERGGRAPDEEIDPEAPHVHRGLTFVPELVVRRSTDPSR